MLFGAEHGAGRRESAQQDDLHALAGSAVDQASDLRGTVLAEFRLPALPVALASVAPVCGERCHRPEGERVSKRALDPFVGLDAPAVAPRVAGVDTPAMTSRRPRAAELRAAFTDSGSLGTPPRSLVRLLVRNGNASLRTWPGRLRRDVRSRSRGRA